MEKKTKNREKDKRNELQTRTKGLLYLLTILHLFGLWYGVTILLKSKSEALGCFFIILLCEVAYLIIFFSLLFIYNNKTKNKKTAILLILLNLIILVTPIMYLNFY